jgi:pyocin large subunit-like protein
MEDTIGRIEAKEFFPGKLEEHHEKHFNEFEPPVTVDEYEAKAKKFFYSEPSKTTELFYDADGVLYKYDKKTNEFGICNSSGIMVSYYLPVDGIKYLYRQVEQYAV